MPDVGILNLQIHDDSAKAAEGLSKLVAKLGEMKDAASKIRLGTVATGIKRINDELSKVQPSAIYKLKQLADVLEKIGSISGNVGGIRISFGGRGQNAEDMAAQLQAARDAVAQTTTGFEQIGQRVQEDAQGAEAFANTMGRVNEIVQQTGWTAQATAEQFAQMFQMMNSIRMSRAIGGGASPFALGDGSGGSGAEWTYWKEGAIEVEGTVTEAMDSIRVGAGDAVLRLTGVVGEVNNESKAFEKVNRTVQSTQESIAGASQITYHWAQKMLRVRELFGSAKENVKDAVASMYGIDKAVLFPSDATAGAESFTGAMQEASDSSKVLQDNMKRDYGAQMVEDLVNASDKADLLKMRIDELKYSLARKIDNNLVDGNQIAHGVEQIQSLQEKYRQLTEETKKAEDAAKSFSGALSGIMFGAEGLKGSISRMFPTLSSLGKRFSNLLKYRALRMVIRQISEAFKEGTENYYRYSQAIGGDFAISMDNASSSLLQMKNSIGAAAAPLMASMIPLLQTVVDWFINVVNYANQFLALMRGQATWSRATKQSAKAFDDVKDKAKGAGAAMKDLLADWDELNIIQSQSSGGASGGMQQTIEDYEHMFEEVGTFDDSIKVFAEGIKEQFGDIFGFVKKIGAALLGWKFANAFGGLLGTLGGLIATGAIVDLEFNISQMLNGNFLKTGDSGWLIADALTTLLGGVLMKKVLTKVLGAGVAKIAIPITLAVTATAGITTLLGNNDVSALSKEALVDSAYNALKVGGVGAYLLKYAGYSLGTSIGGGAGVAVTTMGIIVGLKAIADTVNTREITTETIKSNLLSAGLVGTGLMIGEAVLGGTIGTILTAGGAGAVATLGALFAIEALLTLKEKDPIQWGDYDATEEEIKAFIDEEVFSGAPRVEIDLANATFKDLGENKTALATAAAKVIGTLDSVKLGLSSSAAADLKSDVANLVRTFDETSQNYQDALKISVSLVPVNGSKTESKAIIDNSESRWSELNGIMESLANDLTAAFDTAYNTDLDKVTRENAQTSIEKISGMMAEIADAVSAGQAKAKIAHNLNMQIGNLTKDATDEMIKYYEQQRDELIKQLVEVGNTGAEGLLAQQYSFERLAEIALKKAGGNIEDETYKHYLAQAKAAADEYKARLASLQKDAEKAADETLSDTEGVEKIRSSLLGKITRSTAEGVDQVLANAGVGDRELFNNFIGELLKNILSGDTDSSELQKEVDDILWANLYDLVGGENIDTFKKAIENGIIGYGDLFGPEFVSSLLAGLGTNHTAEETQIINGILRSYFPEYFSGDGLKIDIPLDLAPTVDTSNTEPEYEVDIEGDNPITEPAEVPGVDLTDFGSSMNDLTKEAKDTADEVDSIFSGLKTSLGGPLITLFSWLGSYEGGGGSHGIRGYANGGIVRSGDLVMANENGNFEMMGRIGHQPVVANNEQIVDGISQGVSNANGGVESRLSTIENLLVRILQKEFTAKAVPSSAWGRNNRQSADQYSTVTGY